MSTRSNTMATSGQQVTMLPEQQIHKHHHRGHELTTQEREHQRHLPVHTGRELHHGNYDRRPTTPPPNTLQEPSPSSSSSVKPPVGSPEWHRIRRDNHKEVERRRRETINEGISELAKIVPGCEKAKGSILARAVQYIQQLKDTAATNIEKWTLEKLLTDQAIANLSRQVQELKNDNQRLQDRLMAYEIGQSPPPQRDPSERNQETVWLGEGDNDIRSNANKSTTEPETNGALAKTVIGSAGAAATATAVATTTTATTTTTETTMAISEAGGVDRAADTPEATASRTGRRTRRNEPDSNQNIRPSKRRAHAG